MIVGACAKISLYKRVKTKMKLWKILQSVGFLAIALSVLLVAARFLVLRGLVQEGCFTGCEIGLSESLVATVTFLSAILGVVCLSLARQKSRLR